MTATNTPRVFSSPVSNIDAKETPRIFGSATADSDDDLPSKVPISMQKSNPTMDITRCVGGILGDSSISKIDFNNVSQDTQDMKQSLTHSLASKLATPMRLPNIQQLNMNSAKIVSSVKRLDSMLKVAQRQSTPTHSHKHLDVDNSEDSSTKNLPLNANQVSQTPLVSIDLKFNDENSPFIDSGLVQKVTQGQEVESSPEDATNEHSTNHSLDSPVKPMETTDTLPDLLQKDITQADSPRRSPRLGMQLL